MDKQKRESALHEKLTLAEARARINEFKDLKKVEGKGGGATIPAKRTGSGGESSDSEQKR